MTIKDPLLKMLALEGICKMLFAPQLCEGLQNPEKVEAILANLIIISTSKEASMDQMALVGTFMENFVPMSEKRALFFSNAMIKVLYSTVRAKCSNFISSKMQLLCRHIDFGPIFEIIKVLETPCRHSDRMLEYKRNIYSSFK